MSSFFTRSASQKKRKRPALQLNSKDAASRVGRKDDDSITGSDISDNDAPVEVEESEDEGEDFADEGPAAKRVRLAEQYLANTQKEVLDDGDFDAAEIDEENLRSRTGERLKRDTAESKGKLYKRIAEAMDWRGATRMVLRANNIHQSVTGVVMQGKHIYAVSKDRHLVKFEAPDQASGTIGGRQSRKWKVMLHAQGNSKAKGRPHHTGSILCVAVSQDGKFVATGGADKKLIIWDAATLTPLKVFMQHRDAVTALTFRRGTNQLFSASKDRTIKIWSLDELSYVETLFGHQDEVLDVSALGQEKCVTVGARDRTARLWKVVEESQLVFRGGGSGTTKALESLRRAYDEDSGVDMSDDTTYHEGSMDRVAMIDDDTFVTASDNGSLSLWNVHKKKAVFTFPLAHGLDPPIPLEEASAEQHPDENADEKSRGGKQPRWITALQALPFSDVVISGSWDGYVRAWKISHEKRRIEPLGAVRAVGESVESLLDKEGLSSDSVEKGALEAMRKGLEHQPVKGFVNDLAILETGERGNGPVLIAAAMGKEHRLGRWKELKDGKNYVVIFEVARKSLDITADEEDVVSEQANGLDESAAFEGFG